MIRPTILHHPFTGCHPGIIVEYEGCFDGRYYWPNVTQVDSRSALDWAIYAIATSNGQPFTYQGWNVIRQPSDDVIAALLLSASSADWPS